jgi:hypothetical protein
VVQVKRQLCYGILAMQEYQLIKHYKERKKIHSDLEASECEVTTRKGRVVYFPQYYYFLVLCEILSAVGLEIPDIHWPYFSRVTIGF